MNSAYNDIILFLAKETSLSPEDVRQLIEIPKEDGHGDFAFPCFTLSKHFGKKPNEIAQTLAKSFKETPSLLKAECSGPYLNFFIKPNIFINDTLQIVEQLQDRFGYSSIGNGKTAIIEYSSPNIAKPFSIGHMRSTNIGEALANIYSALGYSVIRLNHLGDWGSQFAKLIVAYQKWGDIDQLKTHPIDHLFKLYVMFHEKVKTDKTLETEAADVFVKLENKDKSLTELWQTFKTLSLNEFERIYKRLNVKFDHVVGESHYVDMADSLIQAFETMGLVKESDGAFIVDLTDINMPPLLLKKTNGTTLYATRDLCAIDYRFKHYHFSKLIYVVGSEQKLHFKQLFHVASLAKLAPEQSLTHVDFGLIRFKDGAMSTREGNIILLEEVLDKSAELAKKIILERNPSLETIDKTAEAIGIGAVKFFDLISKRSRDVVFDWNEILNFDGETGPYLQYTLVRTGSVIRKYALDTNYTIDAYHLLNEPAEFELVKTLARFPDEVNRAGRENEPSAIAKYLILVAKRFNHFYNTSRIIDPSNTDLTRERIKLVLATQTVLKSGLNLLKIPILERM